MTAMLRPGRHRWRLRLSVPDATDAPPLEGEVVIVAGEAVDADLSIVAK
jgi:hypothetical protein